MPHRTIERLGDQSAALEFLARAESYDPPPSGPIVHIATHGSHVFLAGERAYKMKRAVTFPYMDYGTLERRHGFCIREVELNRRTAPNLYLGVSAIVREPSGRLRFDGAGEVVDWIVVMRRFDEQGLLDRMAAAGTLTPAIVERTAEIVRRFHDSAERLPAERAPGGGAEGLRRVLAENFEEFEAQPDRFDAERVRAYAERVWTGFRLLAPLLDRRLVGGMVKHCHGDLHLRNICLYEGEPTLFDGIEFNDDFACIDVLYDLAYLLVDLDIRGRRDLANLALNRYFVDGADYAGLACLPLFLSTRAAVRAKVMVSAAAAQDRPEQREAMLEESRRSFSLAERCLEPSQPVLVALGGFSGSGKSTVARRLAPELTPPPGAIHLRSDVIRKRLFGVEDTVSLPASAYAPEVSAKVYALMLERAEAALRAGYPVLLDAVNDREDSRMAIADLAHKVGVPFHGFWLDAPSALLAARIRGRADDASDATVDVMLHQVERGYGTMDWHRLDATASTEELTRQIQRKIAPR